MTALLALAEREGFSGRHLIDAFIVAVGGTVWGVTSRPLTMRRDGTPRPPSGPLRRRWRRTSGKLDADGIARAMGLAASQADQVDVRHDV